MPYKQDVNVLGTVTIINACVQLGVERLVYTSSMGAVVGPKQGYLRVWNEDTLDWSSEGCVKGINDDGIFYCSCSHLTSFSIGQVVLSANFVDPSDVRSLDFIGFFF